MFKKGDYIVTLKVDGDDHNCARNNYCFKIREDGNYILPEIDIQGSTNNGHTIMKFYKTGSLFDWRYATKQEINYYNKINKPYDINEIKEIIYELW